MLHVFYHTHTHTHIHTNTHKRTSLGQLRACPTLSTLLLALYLLTLPQPVLLGLPVPLGLQNVPVISKSQVPSLALAPACSHQGLQLLSDPNIQPRGCGYPFSLDVTAATSG